MSFETGQKFKRATIVYWVLLAYIIVALIWWAISLLQQNNEIYELRSRGLNSSSPAETATVLKVIKEERQTNIYKYVGEGCAFLLLILIGAFYLYRSVRRQFRVQQQQQNFVMAVTHELKTPIAVSRLNLETLQKYQLEEEKRKKLLQMTLQETMRLDALINNILVSSRLEEQDHKISKEELDLSDVVKDVLKNFEGRYPERKMVTSVADDVDMEGDAMLLKLLLSNLLENANKYSPKDKLITLSLSTDKKNIVLEVADEGPGVSHVEKKAVFEKFYRIGSEETRKTQGTGLGLYICQKIAKDHNGEIFIKDNQPSGSKFIVQFYN